MIKFLHENIRSWLQEKFNEGLEESYFDFTLYHDQEIHTKYVKYKEIYNGLIKKKVPFIPIHIENMEVTRSNIRKTKIFDVVVQSTINIPIEDTRQGHKTFNQTYKDLEDKLSELNVEVFPFGDIKYDMLTASIEFDYNLTASRNSMGLVIELDKDYEGNIYSLSPLGDGIDIKALNGNLDFTFHSNTSTNGELSVPIQDGKMEIVINKTSTTDVDVYVNQVLYEVSIPSGSTISFSSSKDTLYSFNGFINELYTQEGTVDNLQDYLDGNTTIETLFETPSISIQNFTTLDNSGNDNTTITLLSGRVVETGEDGFISPTFNSIAPLTGLFEIEGTNHQQFDLTFNVVVSDIYNGSHVNYYIDDVQIYPITKQHTLANTTTSEQKMEAKVSKGVNSTTAINNEFTLFYDRKPKVIELLHNIKEDSNRQNLYILKIEYPTFTEELEVIISNIGLSPVEVDPLNYSIELALADDILIT
jgi:hypothetical protein